MVTAFGGHPNFGIVVFLQNECASGSNKMISAFIPSIIYIFYDYTHCNNVWMV